MQLKIDSFLEIIVTVAAIVINPLLFADHMKRNIKEQSTHIINEGSQFFLNVTLFKPAT